MPLYLSRLSFHPLLLPSYLCSSTHCGFFFGLVASVVCPLVLAWGLLSPTVFSNKYFIFLNLLLKILNEPWPFSQLLILSPKLFNSRQGNKGNAKILISQTCYSWHQTPLWHCCARHLSGLEVLG